MAEYERSRLVDVSAEDVFAFVTDFRNLVNYVPTVTSVEPTGQEDHVRIRGVFRGTPYDDDVWYNLDENRRRIEWSADERAYSGWLTVSEADGRSQIVVHLSVPPYVTSSGRPITGELTDGEDPYEEGLETALDSLRNLLEGTGGEEEPDVAMS
jgi:hypothetical protein